MSRVAFLLPVCVLVWAAGPRPAGAAVKQSAPLKSRYSTGTAVRGAGDGTSHGLAGGVLICEQQSLRPIAWFGAAKPSAEKSRFLYLLIFKTPAGFQGTKRFFS